MVESRVQTGYKRLWSDVLLWLKAMDDAMDTSETEILERRVRALEQAVEELRRSHTPQPDLAMSPFIDV